jgi:protein-tyrosine-phosphatase
VCTAGRCRSPIAAALFAQRVGRAPSTISIGSAGLRFTGEPTPEIGISLMSERGIDLTEHRSSPVTEQSIKDADLILGMAREHVREIVAISPEAWPKTFTIKDFVRRAERSGPPGRHQRFADWLESIGAEREPYDALGTNPGDEVPDPYGQRAKVWNRVIEDLDDLVSAIAATVPIGGGDPSRKRFRRAST